MQAKFSNISRLIHDEERPFKAADEICSLFVIHSGNPALLEEVLSVAPSFLEELKGLETAAAVKVGRAMFKACSLYPELLVKAVEIGNRYLSPEAVQDPLLSHALKKASINSRTLQGFKIPEPEQPKHFGPRIMDFRYIS